MMRIVAVFIAFFLLAGAVAYAVTPTPTPETSDGKTPNAGPKTEVCPLNNALYTKQQKNAWEKRRPLGIMVENSVDSRPQSGVSNADVVFEAVAEGGITRFLLVYLCNPPEIVGPVRSARVYFMDFIGGFGSYPLYAHVGGANTPGPADALGQLEDMEWANYNDLNQFSVGFPAYWRDADRLPNVDLEHTMYTNPTKLWDIALKRGLSNKDKEGEVWDSEFTAWKYKKESPAKNPTAQAISYGFWDRYSDFDVVWNYVPTTNSYVRSNGGEKHIDKNTDKQLEAKNVVVLFMDESVADDGYEKGQHLLYGTEGSGKAIVFIDGGSTQATWEKKDRFSQIVIKDASGEEVSFNPGQIWFSVVPTGNKVEVK